MRRGVTAAERCQRGPAALAWRLTGADPLVQETPRYQDEATRVATIEEIAREHGPKALGIAHSMLGDRSSAEDAFQDALVQAYRALPGFRGESSLKTWFMRILVNSCRRHRRLWRRFTIKHEAAARESERAREDVHGDPVLAARIEEAIARLPHRQRTAFVLRHVQGMKIAEIALVMNCAEGTVKASVHKAALKLRATLGDVEGGNDGL